MKPCAVCGKPFHFVMVPACQDCCSKSTKQINQAHRNGELGLIYVDKRKETVCLIVNGDWNIQKSGLGEDY